MRVTAKDWQRAVLLATAIAAVALLHYSTPTTYMWAHPLLQRAYYIPILLAALWFGWRGGLAAATLAGASYIPHIVMAWKFEPEYRDAQYIEIGMFFVIATLTGVLADHERAQRRKVEETASRLSEVYTQLQKSFEQLRRADRLSALGELSAGLAHEVRNPLGSIEGAVQILGRRELPEETRQEFTDLASRACFMCAVKGAGQQWVQVPPGNWIAPPGSNRSGGRGNEAVGAFGVEGRRGDLASL